MIPFARLVFYWTEAKERYFQVIDPEKDIYEHGSTVSESTVNNLGLFKVCNAEDEERLLDVTNQAIFQLRRTP